MSENESKKFDNKHKPRETSDIGINKWSLYNSCVY